MLPVQVSSGFLDHDVQLVLESRVSHFYFGNSNWTVKPHCHSGAESGWIAL
jgi:hypothetical protein